MIDDPPAADAPARPLRKVYVRHGPEVWGAARALYLSGMTAAAVARRLGVSVAGLRVAAARGGWTRRDARAEAAEGSGAQGGAAPVAPPPVAPPGAFGEGGEAGAGRFDPPLLPAPGEREAGPTYYRLSDDAWAQIRAEYLGGSTAKALSAKWGVSAGTVYRRAQEGKWTKEQRGAAVSAAAVEAEVASRAGAQARREALAERDAAEASEPEPEPEADPLEAARLLLRRAAGAAQAGRLEAATERVKLAEGLARAARALGLDAEGGWEEEPEEEEGSPEELEALREDVERRYRRFDRAPAEAPPTAEPVALLPEPAEWRPSPPPPEPPVAPAPVSPFPSWAPSFEACWRAAGGGRP